MLDTASVLHKNVRKGDDGDLSLEADLNITPKIYLNLLSEIGEALAGKDGFSAVMIRAFKVLAQRSGVLRGVVLLREGERLELATSYRVPPGNKQVQRWRQGFVTEDAMRRAMAQHKGLYVCARPATNKKQDSASPEKWFLAMPFSLEGETVDGVLCLEADSSLGVDEKQVCELFRVITSMIAQALIINRLVQGRSDLDEEEKNGDPRFDFSYLIGSSLAMKEVQKQIRQAAPSTVTVLVTGETGTGKELVAQALHQNSLRADRPFVKVNCGALMESLIEAELFGHEAGAFTDAAELKQGRFELADGGTLFLDEVGELSLAVQAKLLRVLQAREFERVGGSTTISTDVRIIAATNRNLEQEVKAGRFRADLFYRLNVFTITVPALRERRGDIPVLAEYFLQQCLREHRSEVRRFTQQALDLLMGYNWPGNVRELANTIERAVVLAEGQIIQHYHLPPDVQTASPAKNSASGSLFESVEAYEKELICEALQSAQGHRGQAARELGVSERVLSYKIKKYALDIASFR